MSTWYRVSKYFNEIVPVEVVSETEKSVLVQEEKGKPFRRMKQDEYYPTFAAARTALLDRLNRQYEHHKRQMEKNKREWDQVFLLEESQP
jgi:hypothetical protein